MNIFRLIGSIYRSEKIFLHGLIDINLILLLSIQPWVLKKCYWWIWGNDLYKRVLVEKNLSWFWKEFLRKCLIKRVANLVTYVKGDVSLARDWYGAKGIHRECLLYPSNVLKQPFVEKRNSEKRDLTVIQIGNSATKSNQHIEAMELLAKFSNENIKVILPLSYGCKIYRDEVIKKGKELFADKFEALTEMMPLNEYQEFLSNVDIAIFNNSRQQGMGNLLTLTGSGKKVYLRSETTSKAFFDSIGVVVFDVYKLDISKITPEISESNQMIIRDYCSEENLVNQLKALCD